MAVFLNRAPPADTLAGLRGQKDEVARLGRREIYIHYGDGSKLVVPAAKAGTVLHEHRCRAREEGSEFSSFTPPRRPAAPTATTSAAR
jgi:hypothetical protein